MEVEGFYRRILPSPPAIDFSSSEGKKLFLEAIFEGNMEGFFNLNSYFQTQSEPAYCGLASLSMVLNALTIDPGRVWKAPWRWYDENMLDFCEPLEKVKETGISFWKVVCLANCAGAKVEAFHANQSSIDVFRNHVSNCSSSDDCHLIISYHREVLNQTGIGHFSPIGGYHAMKDMVLILDTARFKYPPHWVPLTLLWEAMGTIDESTGKQRGFMLVSKNDRAPASLYRMSCKHESWGRSTRYLMDDVPALVGSGLLKDVPAILSTIFTSLPPYFYQIIKRVVQVPRNEEDGGEALNEEETGWNNIKDAFMPFFQDTILKQVKETNLFKYITEVLQSEKLAEPTKCKVCTPDSFLNISSTSLCCQAAGIPMGKSGFSEGPCCHDACARICNGAQVANVLVAVSQTEPISGSECCSCGVHRHSPVVLTSILLALPPQTWSAIKDKKVQDDLYALVLTEGLPPLLLQEGSYSIVRIRS